MPKGHWLVKQEPNTYSWDHFVQEGKSAWTGVRNFQARNYLRAMKQGDSVFFYHSGQAKQVVGLARVAKEAYPDPTASDGDWVAVDLEPVKPLGHPVDLATIKADTLLQQILLVRNSRLSVSPLSADQFQRILDLSKAWKPRARSSA